MQKRCILHLLFLSLLQQSKATAPHIIVIVADDLGWSSIGYHNDEVQTPFIDELATTQSLILSRHYVYKYCSPTRSSFLSGRLPLHVNQQNRNIMEPGGGIHLGMKILPQILKESPIANYQTFLFGKWHAGMSNDAYLPANRGFDESFGYLNGKETHWTHSWEDGVDLWHSLEPAQDYKQYNGTYGDLIFNTMAVNTINNFAMEHSNNVDAPERLFMLNSLQVVHDPLTAPQQYLDLYPEDMYEHRRGMNAMASVMDDAVKNITEALIDSGLWNDTILLFFSDNGGDARPSGKKVKRGGNNWPLRGGKHTDFEGFHSFCN